jgi:hypothetical protein
MLGKITQRSLYAGYLTLNSLEESILRKSNPKDINDLCKVFNKTIPHIPLQPLPLTIDTIKIKKQEILTMIQSQEYK